MRDFDQALTQLASGELEILVVERDEFLAFRNSWVAREDKEQFIGEAHQNGVVSYHYLPKS